MLGCGPQVGPFPSRPIMGSIRGEGTPPQFLAVIEERKDHPPSQVTAQGRSRKETNCRLRRHHRRRTTTCRRRARPRDRRLPLHCSLVISVLPSCRRRRLRPPPPPLPPLPPPPPDRSTAIPSEHPPPLSSTPPPPVQGLSTFTIPSARNPVLHHFLPTAESRSLLPVLTSINPCPSPVFPTNPLFCATPISYPPFPQIPFPPSLVNPDFMICIVPGFSSSSPHSNTFLTPSRRSPCLQLPRRRRSFPPLPELPALPSPPSPTSPQTAPLLPIPGIFAEYPPIKHQAFLAREPPLFFLPKFLPHDHTPLSLHPHYLKLLPTARIAFPPTLPSRRQPSRFPRNAPIRKLIPKIKSTSRC